MTLPKFLDKKVDIIIGKNVSNGLIFDSDKTNMYLLQKNKKPEEYDNISKVNASNIIIEKIKHIFGD